MVKNVSDSTRNRSYNVVVSVSVFVFRAAVERDLIIESTVGASWEILLVLGGLFIVK